MANTADGADTGDTRLGELCRRLADPSSSPELGALGEPGTRLVETIVSALRDGRPPTQLEDLLDELEELLLAAGHSAGLGSYRTTPPPPVPGFQSLPVAGPGHPALYVLACPTGHCGRVEAPDADAPDRPACGILGRPLNPVPLR
ncbi:hypothetical protein [Streptomyces purpureus]|uniref:Uncharacterized protein n=1 Tax=Streptomyces purpureus TaxID=1951 RepID=A0A918GXC0_9ACTN|nr:hypothetical protein [Streptomyces purpureus]GGT13964.1 hypothetical protein GCM10014713_03190 [Streptomyces purpureus]